jgi:predicted HAD superfamily Cof-like phosphohydrolase
MLAHETGSGWSNFDDVGYFHRKFGLTSVTHEGYHPRHVPQELLEFRIKFMLEELMEFIEAAGYKLAIDPIEQTSHLLKISDRVDHAKMFDALIDEVYVALGTAHLLGYPWQQGWDQVQAANMAKVRAQKDGSDSARGSSFDVVKPEGWIAPDIAGLLHECGWGTPREKVLRPSPGNKQPLYSGRRSPRPSGHGSLSDAAFWRSPPIQQGG